MWGLDWCPVHPDDRSSTLDASYPSFPTDLIVSLICALSEISCKQYLVVGPLPSQTYSVAIGVKKPRPSPACIQIWSLCSSQEPSGSQTSPDKGIMKCEMVLCLECGPAQELKWCPLPSHDSLGVWLVHELRCGVPTDHRSGSCAARREARGNSAFSLGLSKTVR